MAAPTMKCQVDYVRAQRQDLRVGRESRVVMQDTWPRRLAMASLYCSEDPHVCFILLTLAGVPAV